MRGVRVLTMSLIAAGAVIHSEAAKYNAADHRTFVAVYQHAYNFEWLKYLMYVPADYLKSGKSYPLIVYFHGAEQKGDDPDLLRVCALNKQLDENKKEKFPFIVISPQLPGKPGFEMPYSMDRGTWYSGKFLSEVNDLLDHIIARYAVDTNRIYCAGASMGGFATWEMAIRYPHRFAAIAPCCGEGDPSQVCAIKDVPVWVFHAEADEIMPVKGSDDMISALKACGGKVEFVRPAGGDHEKCWSNQFDELYKWLLTHNKN